MSIAWLGIVGSNTWREGCMKGNTVLQPDHCMITRRRLLAAFGLGALAASFAVEAQQAGKVVTIGILAIEAWPPIDSFRQGLRDLGYVEDKNVRFEIRYAEGRNQRFRELA